MRARVARAPENCAEEFCADDLRRACVTKPSLSSAPDALIPYVFSYSSSAPSSAQFFAHVAASGHSVGSHELPW